MLHNAPVNSRLQVQIVAGEPSSGVAGASAASTGSAQATTAGSPPAAATGSAPAAAVSQNADFNVSFTMDIQRQDVAAPTQISSESVPGSVAVGTLVFVATPQSGSSFALSSWAADESGETAPGQELRPPPRSLLPLSKYASR